MTGNDLKERRDGLRVNQEVLAKKLGVGVSTLARWEQLGDGDVPGGTMLDLALQALEIPNWYLFEWSIKSGGGHIQRLKAMLELNRSNVIHRGKAPDYIPVAIARTADDINAVAEKVEKSIWKHAKERGEKVPESYEGQ